MKLSAVLLMLLPYYSILFSQSTFVPVHNKEYYHLLERVEIKTGQSLNLHMSVKPVERKIIGQLTDSLLQDSSLLLLHQEKFNVRYLVRDNSEWATIGKETPSKPFLKYFYTNKADFYSINTKDFDLHVNPVLYLSLGQQRKGEGSLYLNTRGIELRGMVNRKVGFYTFITDNQAVLPDYVKTFFPFDSVPGVPGEGYTKSFKRNGVDFITARGYFTFNIIKNIQFQFGHDKQFIGNGYRSLILSDFSSNYTFLKINTNVWKINYHNLFAEMNADVFYLNKLYPKKYMALHHLSVKLHRNIDVGIFESVIFGRKDTTKHGQFDFNYLNPIIFYRSVEQQLGSEDNALLGMDVRVKLLKRISLYGQLVLDEFVLKQVREGTGWAGNKQAGQLGLKYFDVAGISTLDLQLETNIVRPYTYSHKDKFRSYTNFNQALAHPLGANFYEWILLLRYQPIGRITATAKLIAAKYGSDVSDNLLKSDNAGGNIFKNYEKASQAYGNKIGQGIYTSLLYSSFNISYQLLHNTYIDGTLIYRKLDSEITSRNNKNLYLMVSLRYNIPQRLNEF